MMFPAQAAAACPSHGRFSDSALPSSKARVCSLCRCASQEEKQS